MKSMLDLLNAATPLITALGILVGVLLQVYNSIAGSQRAKTIALLEQNTNSIKDALIKTTGEAEHAKGVVQGRTEVTAGVALAGVLEAVKPTAKR